jgi:phosphoribosylformylglycinamidine cyclo-ligase
LHSNGFSLVRRIVEVSHADLRSPLGGRSLGEVLLDPTRIYVKSILRLVSTLNVHALCHVTGGGLPENLPRVLPAGTGARIRLTAWRWPPVFDWLQRQGGIDEEEMLRTFNCGIGMIVCVAEDETDEALRVLAECGERAQVIGEVTAEDAVSGVEFVR